MRLFKQSFVLLAGLFFCASLFAATESAAPTPMPMAQAVPQAPTLVPAAPNLDAKGYVLLDPYSGRILAQKNADVRMPPASLTKLMTLYLTANALKNNQIHLTDPVTISKEAWQMGGSRMFVKVGSHVPVRDLISGIIVASGNDATYAIAQYIGGTEDAFVNLMNQAAQVLGMTGTHYTDSNGLPAPDHYTTPRDIATLASAWVVQFPQYYSWFKQKWINYNNIKQPNRNRLLWRDPSVDGLKTGHTDAAGFCLVSSALRNGTRLVSVVMGAPTDSARADDSQALLNYGFRFFESHKLYTGGVPLVNPQVWLAHYKTVALGLAQDLYVTIPVGQYKNLKATTTLNKHISAPIVRGQSYGTLNVTLDGKPFVSRPLVALQDNPTGGWWIRMMGHISYFFHRL